MQNHAGLAPKGRELQLPGGADHCNDDLLALVCHELRSPLASVRHAMRLLGSPTQDASMHENMRALVERQVRRMSSLVDDLLDVSRIANGHIQLECRRIDLRLVARNALETIAPDILTCRHHLSTALPAEPVWVMADVLRLEQVLVNLLANAAKYTKPGGRIALWIHLRENQAVVRVRDSGVGMAAELLPHVFDLYRQAEGADSRPGAGLGIGLALVRELVQLHGGKVTAASRGAGLGSEFTVRIPRGEMTLQGRMRGRSATQASPEAMYPSMQRQSFPE